jgi:hypothetical protein
VEKGTEHLRGKRGGQRVWFFEVADHMDEFALEHPEHAEIIEALAMYLAAVEDTPHEHAPWPQAASRSEQAF